MLSINTGTTIAQIRALGRPKGPPLLKPMRRRQPLDEATQAMLEELAATTGQTYSEVLKQYNARMSD